MIRRRVLAMAASAIASLAVLVTCVSITASAQSAVWPDRPVRFVLPYAPGGATDLIARPWAEKLGAAFNQQFVLEHRGGAGAMIGTEAVAKATPDGYTFLFTPNAPLSVQPNLRKTTYDPIKSFMPVARVGDTLSGFTIHPSVGVKTFKEMIEFAKKNPGKLMFGSAGLGTGTHLRIEMLKYRAGVDILHVPYRGSADALNDLLAGNIHLMTEINILSHVKAGKLILLNVNHTSRHPDFPDVPTLSELGFPNADVPIWFSIWAPAGTPPEIVAKLNAKVVEIAKSDEMKQRLFALHVALPIQTPAELAQFLVDDIARNAEVIKAANIKVD